MERRKVDKKDVILGIIMIILSLYIFLGKNVIVGKSILKENIVIGRADFYIKFLAAFMIIISSIVILKALGILSSANEKTSDSSTDTIIKLFFLALIVYTIILKPLGFFFSSLLLMTFLSLIIRVKETKINPRNIKEIIKPLLISCVFSLISVLSVMYMFTSWLKVILP